MSRGFGDLLDELESKPTKEKTKPVKKTKKQIDITETDNKIKQKQDETKISNKIMQKQVETETMNINSVNEQVYEIEEVNTNGEQQNRIATNNSPATDVTSKAEALLEYRRKATILETHSRYTVLIRKDLLERLDQLADKQERGFKTRVFNAALEMILNEMESLLN